MRQLTAAAGAGVGRCYDAAPGAKPTRGPVPAQGEEFEPNTCHASICVGSLFCTTVVYFHAAGGHPGQGSSPYPRVLQQTLQRGCPQARGITTQPVDLKMECLSGMKQAKEHLVRANLCCLAPSHTLFCVK